MSLPCLVNEVLADLDREFAGMAPPLPNSAHGDQTSSYLQNLAVFEPLHLRIGTHQDSQPGAGLELAHLELKVRGRTS